MATLWQELGEIDVAIFGLNLGSVLVDTLCAERARMKEEKEGMKLRREQLLKLGVPADDPEVFNLELDISWLEHRLG
jgi:hypothetical protein